MGTTAQRTRTAWPGVQRAADQVRRRALLRPQLQRHGAPDAEANGQCQCATQTTSAFFDSRGLATSVFGGEVAYASLLFFPDHDLLLAMQHALHLLHSALTMSTAFSTAFARARSKAPAYSRSTGIDARRRPQAARSSSPASRCAACSPHVRAPCAGDSQGLAAAGRRGHRAHVGDGGERPSATGQPTSARSRKAIVHPHPRDRNDSKHTASYRPYGLSRERQCTPTFLGKCHHPDHSNHS